MLVFIIQAKSENDTHTIAVMPYMKDHIAELLDTFKIPFSVAQAFVYYDAFTGNNFVVHPETHERLWIADKLALQLQGFARLTKEVPKIEPVVVTEASPYED